MGITNGDAVNLIGQATTFAELDQAARIEAVMALPAEQRDALSLHLLFETNAEVNKLKAERKLTTALAHLATGLLAATVGLLGQPWSPTR